MADSNNIIELYFGIRDNIFRRTLISGSCAGVQVNGSKNNPAADELGDASGASNGVASSGSLFEHYAFVDVERGKGRTLS